MLKEEKTSIKVKSLQTMILKKYQKNLKKKKKLNTRKRKEKFIMVIKIIS